jgi:hypothetical protein
MNTEQQAAPVPPASEPPRTQTPQEGVPQSGEGPAAPPPPNEPPPAGWGAPPPPPAKGRWSVRRTIIAVAVAVGIAAAGGVAIYAASGSTDDQAGPGGGPGIVRGNGPVISGGPLGDTGHGEFQNGEVTEISDDSITAKSEDGYTRTYVIDSDTEMTDGIEKGDDVMIVATTSEDDDTATAVMIGEQGQGMMPRRDGQDGGQGGQLPAPPGGN